jgi:hypothetical protein
VSQICDAAAVAGLPVGGHAPVAAGGGSSGAKQDRHNSNLDTIRTSAKTFCQALLAQSTNGTRELPSITSSLRPRTLVA